jgi:hypothetical protein
MVSRDDEAVKVNRGAKKAGVLVEVRVGMLDHLPFDDQSFDLVVIHSASGQLAGGHQRPARRILQRRASRAAGREGRLIAIEPARQPASVDAPLGPAAQAAYDAAGGTPAALAGGLWRRPRPGRPRGTEVRRGLKDDLGRPLPRTARESPRHAPRFRQQTAVQ